MFGDEGSFPHVLWDGFVDEKKAVDGKLPAALQICIDEDEVVVLNVDAPNEFAEPRLQTDQHKCKHEPLPAVELALADQGSS